MILDPLRSMADFSFYQEVPRHSPLRCLGYLAYLGLLFAVYVTGVTYFKVTPIVMRAGEWMAASMPPITFADGKASSAASPKMLRAPFDERFNILIDTSRSEPMTFEEMSSKNIAVMITSDALYVVAPDRARLEKRSFEGIKSVKPFVADAAFYRKVVATGLKALYICMVPLLWIAFFFWKTAAAFFYSVPGLLINEAGEAGLEYPAVLKMALYAQTPWIVLQAVMLTLHRGLPFIAHVAFGLLVTGAYLWKAIGQARQPVA